MVRYVVLNFSTSVVINRTTRGPQSDYRRPIRYPLPDNRGPLRGAQPDFPGH